MHSRLLLLVVVLCLAACSSNSDQAENPIAQTDQTQFLVDNAAREGVFVTESGLQFEVLRAAEGARPSRQSVVTVHYVGTLIDGAEFDSTYSRGQPSTFQLAGTIDGWIEGVQLMNVGSLYRFVIPAELAYGNRGSGSAIAPGDTLVFEVDLLEINSN